MAVIALAAATAGCGGGGGGAAEDGVGAMDPSVSSTALGTARYSQPLVLTVSGSQLDRGLTVAATGCKTITLGSTPPQASSPTTAYYECIVSALGAGELVVTRARDGALLATLSFTVPVPQVTVTLSNGAGVAGPMVFTLAPDKTPVTVDNFLAYVNAGFYDGTVIHRVSPGFVIQGGGYLAPVDSDTPTEKPTDDPIPLEVSKGLSNTQWTLGMARAADPASATSQFFINLADNSASLDPSPVNGAGYAVFGTVSGIDTLSRIVNAPCEAIPFFLPSGECTPKPNVVIVSAVQTQ